MSYLNNLVLDRGLAYAVASVDRLNLLKMEVDTFAAASDPANILGTLPVVLIGPRNSAPNGREVALPAISGIPLTADGQVTAYGLIDEVDQRLISSNIIKFPRDVLAGQHFDLEELLIVLPGLA